MNEKLQQLLAKLGAERDEFLAKIHADGSGKHEDWDKAETKWENLQLGLKAMGWAAAEKAGDVIEGFEEELHELRDEASKATWKLRLKTADEMHDMGEGLDGIQTKLTHKAQDVRLEVEEEMHELGEELGGLYQKIRHYFS